MILETLIDQLHGSEINIPSWYEEKLESLEELAELIPGPFDVLEMMRQTIIEHKRRYPEDWGVKHEMSCPECTNDMKKIVPFLFQGDGVISFQCKACKIVAHKDIS